MHKEFILSIFSKDRSLGIKLCKEFELKENSEDIARILGRTRVPPVMGDERFMWTVKEHFFNKKTDKAVPQSNPLAPSSAEIRSADCKFYGIDG